MANKEVGALIAATALAGTETLHVVQGGNSRRATVDQIRDRIDLRASRTLARSTAGALATMETVEEDIVLVGPSVVSSIQIPAGCILFAVASRTTVAITGAPSYGVGIAGEETKFGGDLGTSLGSTNAGIIGPQGFYSNTALVITATSGSFTGGRVRATMVFLRITPPTS